MEAFFKKNTLRNILIQSMVEAGLSIALAFGFVFSFGMNSPLTLMMVLVVVICMIKVITLMLCEIDDVIKKARK